ncbi:MAG: S41 family peptidase [Frankiaceae bacterium]
MRSLPPRLRSGPVRVVATVALVAVAYGAGVATGVRWPGSGPASHGADLDAVRDRLAAQALRPVTDDRLDDAAVKAMIKALDDPWSSYFDADDYARYQQSLDGEYDGVGLLVRERGDGAIVVSAVQGGSPAARADIAVGSTILAVDGRPTLDRSAGQIAQQLRGDRGTSVLLTLSWTGRVQVVHLVRARLAGRDVSVDWLAPQVARVTITAFTRGVGRQVRDAVARLRAQHAGGIVLDLRGDPGGLLDEAVEAASAFLDGGAVVSYERRGQPLQALDAERGGDTATPVAVLVDGGTASAAEVLAGALQDRGRAVIVGTRTFGKGTVQQPVHLSGGSVAEMTVAHYRTPSGRSLDGVGLSPDIEVSPGAAPQVAERRAVQVLSGLLADAGTGGRG